MLSRRAFASGLGTTLAAATLGGCAEPVRDPPEAIEQARYRGDGPPSISLFTMVRVQTGKGAHTGLLIDGPERVVFDPAGSYRHPRSPRINDLHYGMTPKMEAWYIDYHARATYSVRRQTRQVSPETAAAALARAQEMPRIIDTFCTLRTCDVLAGLPGFEEFPRTLFPDVASRAFSRYPGVRTEMFTDDSPDDRSDIGGLSGYIPLPDSPGTSG